MVDLAVLGLKVGPDDLKDPLQSKRFYDSI